jgi:sugar phosphate isomerase/epimerase
MKPISAPRLRHIANLWSLVEYPDRKREWPLERKLTDVKAAGFDGFSTLPTKEHGRLAKGLGLILVGYFSSSKAADFEKLIVQNLEAGAVHINVQLGDHDTLTPKALQLALHLMKVARKHGAQPAIEVHRDTCTETPEKTYALADAYRKATGELLPLTWDFSHLAVVKHLGPPYAERLLVAPNLVQRSQQFHFRPFNGHHAQVPVTDGTGKLSRELTQWLPFLEQTLALWLKGKQGGRELFVVPEMGPIPGGYNLAQLPNSWEDAKVLRTLIAKTWKKVLSAQAAIE